MKSEYTVEEGRGGMGCLPRRQRTLAQKTVAVSKEQLERKIAINKWNGINVTEG
jgi:hypothetical protein